MPGSQADTLDAIKTAQPLLFAADTPKVGELQKEFERAGGFSVTAYQRERNDRIRFNRWKGRTSDFRKHRSALNATPDPWENSSDARVYLADSVIEDCVDVLTTAFDRAEIKLKPTEAGDIRRAGQAKLVLDKYRERMRPQMRDESEYLAQWGLNDSAAVFHLSWDRCVALKQTPVTLDELVAASVNAARALAEMPPQEIPPEMLDQLERIKVFPMIVVDPAMEAEAVALLQQFARELAAQLYVKEREEYGDDFLENYELSTTKARHAIRELRARGRTTFPSPYLAINQPSVVTRRMGYDYFCPPEMTDLQSAAWHAVREFLTPEQIMGRQVSDGWDYDWCLEVIKTAGQTSAWGVEGPHSDGSAYQQDDEEEQCLYHRPDTKSGLCEVIHFYKRYLTTEGIPQIYCTVFSPHITKSPMGEEHDFCAKHYPFAELPEKYPFVGYRWQKKTRAFAQGMGVPQIVGSDQASVKWALDLLLDRMSIEVNPERIVNSRLGSRYKAGPGSQTSSQQYYGNRPLIEYANPPSGNPQIAFELMEQAHKRVDNYFGLMTERVAPAKWQAKLQRMTERYLGACAEMWAMVFQLIQRNADERELSRIAGGAVEFPSKPEDIAGSYDVGLYFDVKDLDMEFVWKKLEAVTKIALPSDAAGIIPRDKLTRLIMQAIDPSYAQALEQDTASASQKLFADTRNALALMFDGNPPDPVENDPTAGKKLQFAQQIIYGDAMGRGGNVKYQKQLQEDPVAQQHLQTWEQNLQQSVKQEKNKEVGRLGVDPEAMSGQEG